MHKQQHALAQPYYVFALMKNKQQKKEEPTHRTESFFFFVSVQSFSLDCAQKLSKKKKSKKKGEKDE